MKPLHKKKAIRLNETRLRPAYVVMTVIFYLLAAILYYLLAVFVPYTQTVRVSAAENAKLTREAFSATAEQINADPDTKERALLMPTSEDSYLRRLKLVDDAQYYIDFMVFDTYDENYSYYWYTALIRAADRGVKVRIVLDGKMGRLVDEFEKLGEIIQNHNKMELYYFNCLNIFDPGGIMALMHDKVTLVDGNKLIVGGVNMGKGAYLSNYDMEVMVTNSGENGAAGQARAYFDKMIKSDCTERIKSKSYDKTAKNRYIAQYEAFFGESEYADKEIDYTAQGIPVDKITFLNNPISARKKSPIILQAVFNLMESSKKTTVVTPYMLLENDKKRKVLDLAAKNEQFTVITNSLYNTRNVGYADYYFSREIYLDNNLTLMELQSKNQLHAKMFSFDDRYSIIGSFNFDERSAHIDTESVLVIDSPEFNAALNAYIDEVFVKNSLRVGKNNEYVHSDTVAAPEAPTKKHVLYGLYRVLSVVRCLL